MKYLDAILPPTRSETARAIGLPATAGDVPTFADLWKVDGETFNEKQREAFHALATLRGLVGDIGVGFGKTLIALQAPRVMGLAPGDYLLLVPASTRNALIREARKWEALIEIPSGIRVMSYEELSNPDGYSKLVEIAPRFIMADEAHYLRRPSSARTKRLRRWFKEFPECGFAAISGTLTKDSILDFAHLAEWALRDSTPLPRSYSALESWRKTIDPISEFLDSPAPGDWGAVQTLVNAFGNGERLADLPADERSRVVRAAFKRRLLTAPGVVVATGASVGCSIYFEKLDVEIPAEIADAFTLAARDWQRLDGEFLDGPLDRARYFNQLSSGFYYRWDWDAVGGVDLEWLYARRAYFAEVRKTISRGFRGVDTEYHVRDGVESGRFDKLPDLIAAAAEWEKHKHKTPPPTVAVWLSDFLVDDIVRRIQAPTLVWVSWEALATRLGERGYVVGDPESRDPSASVVVSVSADQRGKNLQAWSRNLIVNPPASGMAFEQLLGRTHRQGQRADTVEVSIYQHTQTLQNTLDNAIREAEYVYEIKEQPQKLLYGDWS